MEEKEYKLSIDPRILELLGPSLYTNIYYVLAELIANAYDADAHNVYIISSDDSIIVEDDGKGMSYKNGDIKKYLSVAEISRNTNDDSVTNALNRKKMGRKGVGKLAALSVSENVLIKTISNGEKSGFILSRHVEENNLLKPLSDDLVTFEKIEKSGTAVVMQNPQYRLNNSITSIKKNLLKIFPLIDDQFKIHLIIGKAEETIDSFDKDIMNQLSCLLTLGKEFTYLNNYFYPNDEKEKEFLLKNNSEYKKNITMQNNLGKTKDYILTIKGWIGAYKSTRGRKLSLTEFPDNFVSLYANSKLGEFNILPLVGENKLTEVYIVGQLHVDIFELTELPDIALSNRQGYKSDDPRYQAVLKYTKSTLLPEILKMRNFYVDLGKKEKELLKLAKQKEEENYLKKSVENFRKNTSANAAAKISEKFGITGDQISEIETILSGEINENSPDMGLKKIVDSKKKKILISQTEGDKDLADVIYEMLKFNNVPPDDIIYTNCDDEISRIPEGDVGKSGIYDYLRDFFVDSYSTQKIYVIFVTSHSTKASWGALTEVGAAWITQIEHKIFNISDFRPEHPLDDESQWHTSKRDEKGDLLMTKLSQDIFCQKIEFICDKLSYKKQTRDKNKSKLETLVNII